jgi:hypothetical protein
VPGTQFGPGQDRRLVETLNLAGQALEVRSLVASVESGQYVEPHRKYFDPETRIDSTLLSNLRETLVRLRGVSHAAARDLIIRLRRDEALRSRLIINSQLELLPESAEEEPEPLGYLDIAIQFSVRDEQLCLAIECKRLNVPRFSGPAETLAGRYVEEGMMRFVSRHYSPDLPLGGMIGYVMDGDVAAAHAAIHREIERAAGLSRCQSPYVVVLQHPGVLFHRSRHVPGANSTRMRRCRGISSARQATRDGHFDDNGLLVEVPETYQIAMQ